MQERKKITQEFLTGERALFKSDGLDIYMIQFLMMENRLLKRAKIYH